MMARQTRMFPAAVARTKVRARRAHQLDDSSTGDPSGELLLKMSRCINALSVIILQFLAPASLYIYMFSGFRYWEVREMRPAHTRRAYWATLEYTSRRPAVCHWSASRRSGRWRAPSVLPAPARTSGGPLFRLIGHQLIWLLICTDLIMCDDSTNAPSASTLIFYRTYQARSDISILYDRGTQVYFLKETIERRISILFEECKKVHLSFFYFPNLRQYQSYFVNHPDGQLITSRQNATTNKLFHRYGITSPAFI